MFIYFLHTILKKKKYQSKVNNVNSNIESYWLELINPFLMHGDLTSS